jgi:hypothetical protein
MVPPRRRAGACTRSAAVACIVIEVSEAREARRLALTRPAVPLNIAARSPLLLLYTSSVFGRKSKLAWLPRAYRTPMMPCCRPTARGLSVAETPRVKAQPRKHRQPTAQPPCFTAALASFTACGVSTMVHVAACACQHRRGNVEDDGAVPVQKLRGGGGDRACMSRLVLTKFTFVWSWASF